MPTARSPEQPADELLPPGAGPTGQQIAALDAAVTAAFPAFGSLVSNDSADIKGRVHAYLNLPGLLQAVQPALMAQQVIICNTISLVPGGFVVITMLLHSSGGWRLSQFPVLSLTSSSAISAAATSGFRVNLQLLLGVCASYEDTAHEASPTTAAAPMTWESRLPVQKLAQPPAPAQPQQPWVAPAPNGGYDMTRAIPAHEAAAMAANAQQQLDPSSYV